MTNTNAQHFVVAIHYESGDSDVFDPEGIGDLVYDNFCDSDNIHRIDKVVTHEEPIERPTSDQLDDLLNTYRPTISESASLPVHQLAVTSLLIETLAYANGETTIQELHQAIERAKHLATPIAERLAHREVR